jgi:hypothetical protein
MVCWAVEAAGSGLLDRGFGFSSPETKSPAQFARNRRAQKSILT